MKRVFIIHGWYDSPEGSWFPWLKKELEQKGFEVIIPEMPETASPKINPWVSKLAETAKNPDENTYFVGHSIGCQTILRYLETLPEGTKIGGAVFAGGWFKLTLNDEEEIRVSKPWLETPIDFAKVKTRAKKFVSILSDDDPYVPLENKELFEKNLAAEVVIVKGFKHFMGEDGITELPIVLKKILEMAGKMDVQKQDEGGFLGKLALGKFDTDSPR